MYSYSCSYGYIYLYLYLVVFICVYFYTDTSRGRPAGNGERTGTPGTSRMRAKRPRGAPVSPLLREQRTALFSSCRACCARTDSA